MAALRGLAPEVCQVLGRVRSVCVCVGVGGVSTSCVQNRKITLCCISLKWKAKGDQISWRRALIGVNHRQALENAVATLDIPDDLIKKIYLHHWSGINRSGLGNRPSNDVGETASYWS